MYSTVLILLLLSFVLPPFFISAFDLIQYTNGPIDLSQYEGQMHVPVGDTYLDYEMNEENWEGGGISVQTPKNLESQVCTPIVTQIVVSNESPAELTLLAVSSSCETFRFSFFDPISLEPEASHNVSVVFLAHEVGLKSCDVTLVTSEGEVVGELSGTGSESDSKLRMLHLTAGPGVERFLHLPWFNPRDDLLQVVELTQTNTNIIPNIILPKDFLDPSDHNRPFLPALTNGWVKFQVVTPLSPSDEEELVYVTLKYEYENEDNKLHMFIIPVSIKVTTGLVAPEFVDFGILTSSNSWAKLPVELHNPTEEYLVIESLSTSSGLNGETGLAPVTAINCDVFRPGATQTVWVTWAGTYEGELD
eukprot:CAMPEP_0197567160 /NCGR_PEP_ID=MMETSP1320-20131121/35133_1 /TAXON_ID=91990 /ORGANISM="Bolidomonas sp., Strain RCC2347" /LENGTH=361 /DNA_ID=CAMNT_0043129319 /DNA_START=168 /DNA_END=1250 /DNA_ORIENTATION=-